MKEKDEEKIKEIEKYLGMKLKGRISFKHPTYDYGFLHVTCVKLPRDIFVHQDNIVNGNLEIGDTVTFVLARNMRGFNAQTVKIIKYGDDE